METTLLPFIPDLLIAVGIIAYGVRTWRRRELAHAEAIQAILSGTYPPEAPKPHWKIANLAVGALAVVVLMIVIVTSIPWHPGLLAVLLPFGLILGLLIAIMIRDLRS